MSEVQADRFGRTTLRNVQGLRGIAALIVVFAHVTGRADFEARLFGSGWIVWSNLPANTGVDLFFAISGLIMTVTTWRSFDAPGSARRFLWRRMTRIYPLYWLISTPLVLVFLVSPGMVDGADGHPPNLLASYLLLPQNGQLPLMVAWTLVYEMSFYLLFTVALLLGRRWFGWVIGGWATTTVALHLLLGQPAEPVLRLVSGPLSLEFVFGVLIGYAVVRDWLFAPRAVLAAGVVSVIGVLGYLGASGKEFFPSEAWRVAVPGLAMAVVVYGAVAMELRRGAVVPAVLQHLGDSSFSLYLIHVPALTALRMVLANVLPVNALTHAIVLVLVPVYVIVVAKVCYRFVERPLARHYASSGAQARSLSLTTSVGSGQDRPRAGSS